MIAIRDGQVQPEPVLDLRGESRLGGEQGLLGIAFSPDGRFVYVNYTDVNGDTNVDEFAFRDGRADPGRGGGSCSSPSRSRTTTAATSCSGPTATCTSGWATGGAAAIRTATASTWARSSARCSASRRRRRRVAPTGSRRDNPFVGRSGARPEIWAYGLRNPWRYSFDRETGDLWIGDVGQNAVGGDRLPAGGFEGRTELRLEPAGGHPPVLGATPPANAVPPVYEFPHDDGACAVTGGYVYRGEAIPGLRGAYLFADYVRDSSTRSAWRAGTRRTSADLGLPVQSAGSFGQDDAGELYVLSLGGTVYRIAAA